MNTDQKLIHMRRITLSLPDALHEQLRREALRSRISMSSLIRSKLESETRSNPHRDPLLRVAGICRGPVLRDSIDNKLYEI
jgi:hypothetical protein